MKKTSGKFIALTLLIAAIISLTFLKAKNNTEQKDSVIESTSSNKEAKSPAPILLEKIEAGYKFYSPCINYSGEQAKNEGC